MAASVIDVAEYILTKHGQMSTMKLHRLVYYSQAWHLVWDGVPLFDEEIQAWANGPVVPVLYELHRGEYTVEPGFFYAKLREQQESVPAPDPTPRMIPSAEREPSHGN